MRSIAAQGSAGDGRVVATVNGYGRLTRMRIAPEILGDLPRLGGLVAKAVNRAVDEAERRAPPPPLASPFIDVHDLPPPPRPSDPADPAPTSGFYDWLASLRRFGWDHVFVYIDAIKPILARIRHDLSPLPRELDPLLNEIALRLGDPSLNAVSARQGAGIDDPSILRRFRRHAGISLSWYIRERRRETVARLAYSSDLPLEDVAAMLGFRDGAVVKRFIDRWAECTLEDMREDWIELGADYVVGLWFRRGEATPQQAAQIIGDLCQRNPALRAVYEEYEFGAGGAS